MKKLIIALALAAVASFAQTAAPANTTDAVSAHRTKIEQAITARDYNAWKAEHDAWNANDSRLNGKVTAENFSKFAQMYEARKSGDMATAQKLRAELGIESKGRGQGKGQGQGMGQAKGQGQGAGKGRQGGGNCK